MGLFITTPPTRHGVFIYEATPPIIPVLPGTGQGCLVEQLPWGPAQSLYTPTSMADWVMTYAPPGFDHLNSGYLAAIKKTWPLPLKTVRVMGTSPGTATILLTAAGPVTIVTLTVAWPGAAGNSITATTSSSSDGIVGHFKLTVQITGASGTTTEVYDNINVSGTGANVVPDLSKSRLLAANGFVITNAGTPTSAVFTASGGTTPAVTSASYVGTAGAGDKGFALLESDLTIDCFFVGDPGASLRAAVNSGGVSHAFLKSDRLFLMNGVSGQTASAAQTDVANYRSQYAIYVDPWCNMTDDVTGATQLQPSASFAASVICQVVPSTSPAGKSTTIKNMLQGIASPEVDRGESIGQNTTSGIMTLFKASTGGMVFEAGKLTDTTAGQTNVTRRRMLIYIGRALRDSSQSLVDMPNVDFFQQQALGIADAVLSPLKINRKSSNVVNLPYINNYSIGSTTAANSPIGLAGGDFNVQLAVQIGSNMERINYTILAGEGVNPQAQVQTP